MSKVITLIVNIFISLAALGHWYIMAYWGEETPVAFGFITVILTVLSLALWLFMKDVEDVLQGVLDE